MSEEASPETIHEVPILGKNYRMIDTLTFGEVSTIRKSGKHFIGLSERIKGLGGLPEAQFAEEINKISNEILLKSDETDDLVKEALERCYGLKSLEVKKLKYVDAAVLFSELLTHSTIPKKKLLKPSTSPSSSEPQTTQ